MPASTLIDEVAPPDAVSAICPREDGIAATVRSPAVWFMEMPISGSNAVGEPTFTLVTE